MVNPWEVLNLEHYESHMQYQNVQQAQVLNFIMKKQFNAFSVKSICILGISGGNGLEHIDIDFVSKIYGLDINDKYLSVCHKRFSELGDKLELRKVDLMSPQAKIPDAEFIIANLLVEYLGCEIFKNILMTSNARYISCVIQKSHNSDFVSSTPFEIYFHDISSIHNDIDKSELMEKLNEIGFEVIYTENFKTPNDKVLIRLDFERK
ncbi:methyltransferase type 11 [Citrobacter braakii]|nr:methyltransferase type 11 [Citrobacter braakii]